eukprot:10764047-Prorocentrum_lima.AAC.1
MVVIHFLATPEVTTVVGVHETSNIPALLSSPQMRSFGFTMDLQRFAFYLTCPSLGYNDERIMCSRSRHL